MGSEQTFGTLRVVVENKLAEERKTTQRRKVIGVTVQLLVGSLTPISILSQIIERIFSPL